MFTSVFVTVLCVFFSSPVVSITTDSSLGTGFSIGNGVIVTNSHVIEDAEFILIESFDKQVCLAEILDVNRSEDLAFLSIDIDVPSVRFADSFKKGDSVFTFGNGGGKMEFRYGKIEQIDMDVNAFNHLDEPIFFNDVIGAYINIVPGNSGGPLFNQTGEVIGVISAGIFKHEIGFAIPTQVVLTHSPLTTGLALKWFH